MQTQLRYVNTAAKLQVLFGHWPLQIYLLVTLLPMLALKSDVLASASSLFNESAFSPIIVQGKVRDVKTITQDNGETLGYSLQFEFTTPNGNSYRNASFYSVLPQWQQGDNIEITYPPSMPDKARVKGTDNELYTVNYGIEKLVGFIALLIYPFYQFFNQLRKLKLLKRGIHTLGRFHSKTRIGKKSRPYPTYRVTLAFSTTENGEFDYQISERIIQGEYDKAATYDIFYQNGTPQNAVAMTFLPRTLEISEQGAIVGDPHTKYNALVVLPLLYTLTLLAF